MVAALIIMSTIEKLIGKFKQCPKDFNYQDAKRILEWLGYLEDIGGKTAGSAVRFLHSDGDSIRFHKPHPGSELKMHTVKEVVEHLIGKGRI